MQPNPPTIRTARIIWVALLVSVAIYGLVAWMAGRKDAVPATLDQRLADPVILVLIVMSVVMFAMAFLMGRVLLARPEHPPVMSVWIIQWSLLESASIFGLIATLLTGDLRLFLGPAVLAAAGFLMILPSEERMKDVRHPSSFR